MIRLWLAPNRAGVPGALASEVVAEGGVNPNIGKGALITLQPGTTVPNTGPAIKLDWVGATVTYDDLGFFDDSVGFIIPTVDPPILRVRMWTFVLWPPALGTRGMFHGFVGGNVPFTGGGFDQLPETSDIVQPYRNTLPSASFPINTTPFNTDLPLNCFVLQVSPGSLILSQQQMAIEVVS